MKLKLSRYSILIISIIFIWSCGIDETESLFDQTPTERINSRTEELKTLLLDEQQGYSATYFSDNTRFGGFNFHMKFNNDLTVEMTSDIDSLTDITKSRYDVKFGSTVELVFTTNSKHIHKLIQDGGDEFNSFQGSSSFQYLGNENDMIIFTDIRSDGILTLTPSGFTNFATESIESANLTFANRGNFTKSSGVTLFPFLSTTINSETQRYALNYSTENLFANLVGKNKEEEILSEEFGTLFTKTGLKISPALEIDGVVFEEFTLDSSSASELQYKSTVGNSTAVIGYDTTPVLPFTGQNILPDFLILHEPFLNSLAGNWNPDLTNNFREFLSNLNASISFMDVTRIDYNDLNTDSPTLFIGSSIGNAFYNLSKEIKDDKLFLTLESTTVPAFFTDAIAPLLDILLDSDGLYVDQPTTLDAFTNRIFSFIPASNTKIRFSAVQL